MTTKTTTSHDILVTTPKSQIEHAAREAKHCMMRGGGYYFRRFAKLPKLLKERISKVFYVEDGYIRGYGTVTDIQWRESMTDSITDEAWPPGYYIAIPADSWKWIRPIPYKGFQGFRYIPDLEYEIVGDWLDPMPEV